MIVGLVIIIMLVCMSLLESSRFLHTFLFETIGVLFGFNQSKEIQQLKSILIENRNQLTKISAMDEFAKWARLRRIVDKNTEEFEKKNSWQNMKKIAFESTVSIFIKFIIGLIHLYMVYSYYSVPMFYLPLQWTGNSVAWLMNPFGESGYMGFSLWLLTSRYVLRRLME